jgi:hypothetical protein
MVNVLCSKAAVSFPSRTLIQTESIKQDTMYGLHGSGLESKAEAG